MEHKIDLICSKCGYRIEDAKESDYRFEGKEKRFPYCVQCNNIMKHSVAGIGRSGDYEHISDSLAVHTDLIPEHKKLFPGIELTSEGQPIFTSPKQQEHYAEKCGFYKKRQRIKPKGKRII